MPKPNYAFEKRQRELAKKKKKEEKLEEKAQRKAAQARGEGDPLDPAHGTEGAGASPAMGGSANAD
jgi:hypothetical protein